MSKPKAGKRPVQSCHPSPTLSQTVRQLQHHFSVAKSVTSTARQDVRTHRCSSYWKHKVGKRPAPSRNRSPTLSQTVRGHRHSPNTVSRCSRVGRVDLPRQHADQHRHDRIPNVSKLPGSHTLEVCARQPAQPHHRFRMVENLTVDRLQARQDACGRRCVNGYQRSANSLRRRASHTIAL